MSYNPRTVRAGRWLGAWAGGWARGPVSGRVGPFYW